MVVIVFLLADSFGDTVSILLNVIPDEVGRLRLIGNFVEYVLTMLVVLYYSTEESFRCVCVV